MLSHTVTDVQYANDGQTKTRCGRGATSRVWFKINWKTLQWSGYGIIIRKYVVRKVNFLSHSGQIWVTCYYYRFNIICTCTTIWSICICRYLLYKRNFVTTFYLSIYNYDLYIGPDTYSYMIGTNDHVPYIFTYSNRFACIIFYILFVEETEIIKIPWMKSFQTNTYYT